MGIQPRSVGRDKETIGAMRWPAPHTILKSILFFALPFLFWIGGKPAIAQSDLRSHKVLSSTQLKEDVAVLEQALRFARPMLDKEFSNEWLDKRFKKLNAELSDSMSYLAFLRKVALLLTETRSFYISWGHSREYMQFRNREIPLFPLRFEICDGRFFLTKALNGETWPKGVELLSIDGVACGKYLKENYALLPIEGENHFLQDRWLEAYFANHHGNFWSQPDSFVVEWADAEGKKRISTVAAVLMSALQPQEPVRAPVIARDSATGIPVIDLRDYLLHKTPLPDWRVDSLLGNLHSDPVMVLDLTGFNGLDLQLGSVLLSRLYPEAHHFYDRLEDFSVDGKGGWRLWKPDSLSAPPVPFPLPNPYQVFSGKLIVVVDGATSSFKRLLAAHLSHRPNTVLMGELPIGNSYSVLADLEIRSLPHSGISISIPKVRLSVKGYAMEGQEQLRVDKVLVRKPGVAMQRLVLDGLASQK